MSILKKDKQYDLGKNTIGKKIFEIVPEKAEESDEFDPDQESSEDSCQTISSHESDYMDEDEQNRLFGQSKRHSAPGKSAFVGKAADIDTQ